MGNEVKEIRKKYGLTQEVLAKKMGITQSRISRMERQKTLTLETVKNIAKALGISAKDLINNSK